MIVHCREATTNKSISNHGDREIKLVTESVRGLGSFQHVKDAQVAAKHNELFITLHREGTGEVKQEN